MGKRKFFIAVTARAILELDDAVIDVVDDEWREYLYQLDTPEEIAEMVGRCMIAFRSSLSQLDGWADQPDENAKFIEGPDWETVDVVELSELYIEQFTKLFR